MSDALAAVLPANLEKHIQTLTREIGIRLAGSTEERQAAEAIGVAFTEAGAAVHVESFPVLERRVDHEELEVRIHGVWQAFPCSLFSSTPGTGGERTEAPMVFFDAPTDYQRPSFEHLRGKAVVHLGCHIESRESYRRLVEAGPAFLLFVDIRYPGTQALADGMFPSYTRDIGARPTLNVAYMDAWEWKRCGADAARIRVGAERYPSSSSNVVAELPGSDPAAGVLYCGAHHDTQAGTVGADDNASGVATLLELARVLAPVERLRTIRLISFGAEEQLSVGSACYVRKHRDALGRDGRLMLNVDSCGTLLGWNELNGTGPEAMFAYIAKELAASDLYFAITKEVVPYTDQFAFAVAGVPGVWLSRRNCTAGRFFHHRADDTMERLSCDVMAQNTQAMAHILAQLATLEALPFQPEIPPEQHTELMAFWQDLYGGWEGLA